MAVETLSGDAVLIKVLNWDNKLETAVDEEVPLFIVTWWSRLFILTFINSFDVRVVVADITICSILAEEVTVWVIPAGRFIGLTEAPVTSPSIA